MSERLKFQHRPLVVRSVKGRVSQPHVQLLVPFSGVPVEVQEADHPGVIAFPEELLQRRDLLLVAGRSRPIGVCGGDDGRFWSRQNHDRFLFSLSLKRTDFVSCLFIYFVMIEHLIYCLFLYFVMIEHLICCLFYFTLLWSNNFCFLLEFCLFCFGKNSTRNR